MADIFATCRPYVIDGMIRVGRDRDGGYVVPKSIVLQSDILLSFGISSEWSFEEDFHNLNPGCVIRTYDPTVSRSLFLGRFLQSLRLFVTLGCSPRRLWKNFYILWSFNRFVGRGLEHYKKRLYNSQLNKRSTTIDDVFSDIPSDSKVFVKMDIEGGEYRVIDDLLRYVSQIVAFVVEFHDTEPLREIFEKKILEIEKSFDIVHFHANNCAGAAADRFPDVVEITFVRKGLISLLGRRTNLPLPSLDFPNSKSRPDFSFEF
jgi:hypothetical protein